MNGDFSEKYRGYTTPERHLTIHMAFIHIHSGLHAICYFPLNIYLGEPSSYLYTLRFSCYQNEYIKLMQAAKVQYLSTGTQTATSNPLAEAKEALSLYKWDFLLSKSKHFVMMWALSSSFWSWCSESESMCLHLLWLQNKFLFVCILPYVFKELWWNIHLLGQKNSKVLNFFLFLISVCEHF